MGSSPDQLGPGGQALRGVLNRSPGAGGASRFGLDAAGGSADPANAEYNRLLQTIRAPTSNIGDAFRAPANSTGYQLPGLDGGPPLPAPLIMPTPPARQALASIISRPLNTSGNGSAGQRSSSSGYGGSARGGASGGSSARGGSRR